MSALTPARYFDTITAFQKSDALNAALDLSVFTAIGEGNTTPDTIAARTKASPRGIRILCDYLVINGFLEKNGTGYKLAADTALFLDENSPAYMGGTRVFLRSSMIRDAHAGLTDAVRNGRTSLHGAGSVEPDHPVWQTFARAMMPMMFPPAQHMAKIVGPISPCRVLDIAASHGIFGAAIAQANPNAQITALDFGGVLEVAKETVNRFGLSERYQYIPGSVFDVELGGPYDVVLLTNLLHHFSAADNEKMLKRIRAAMAPGGRVLTLDFVPNDDRITPPMSGQFSMMMLASTAEGDAYTFNEYDQMFRNAGFPRSEIQQADGAPQQIITSYV